MHDDNDDGSNTPDAETTETLGRAGSQSLIRDLTRLGLRGGDMVMVHASLRALGPVIGGPATVAQALRDVVGPQGTLTAYVSWDHSPYDATLWGGVFRGRRNEHGQDSRHSPLPTQASVPSTPFFCSYLERNVVST